jgi:predicted acyl esterase
MGARAFLDFLAWTTFGLAQDYVGYDVKAPARDGSSLASTVFLHSSGGTAKSGRFPTLAVRSPLRKIHIRCAQHLVKGFDGRTHRTIPPSNGLH